MKKERLNEILGLFCLAVSIFVFFSLVTYDPNDNSFFTSHPNPMIENGAGMIGAWISYALMFTFGFSSYIFPLIFIFWAISFVLQKVPDKMFFKIVGFVIFQSSTAAVFSLLSMAEKQFAMGGIWGTILASNLERYFGFGGGLIISISCFVLSFILATEYLIFPYLSKGFMMIVAMIMNALNEFPASRQEAAVPDLTEEPKKSRKKKVAQKKGKIVQKKRDKKAVAEDEDDEDEDEDETSPFDKVKVPKLKVKKYSP